MTAKPYPVLDRMLAVLHAFRAKHDGRDPRELRLTPRMYRAFRDAGDALYLEAGVDPNDCGEGDTFCDVPVRCTERLGIGVIMIAAP